MREGGGAREPAELAGSGEPALPRTPDRPGMDGAGTDGAGTGGPGLDGPGADGSPVRLPVLPGFREMALRRMSQDRRRLMRQLA